MVLTASGVMYLALAPSAGASWPFATTQAAGESPILHNPGQLELLASSQALAQGGADIAVSEGAALMANTGPGGSVSYVESRPAKGAITTYTVKEGDSLSEIASSHGVSTNTILWANDIRDASLIKAGMNLIVLPVSGVQYKVKSGDTIGGIAKKYSGDAADIASFNGLSQDAGLTEGSVVIIPGGALAEAPAKKKTTASSSSSSKASPKAARSLPALSGFFGNPLPGGKLSQGIHGYNGVDIAAPSGTAIYAAAAGSVIVAKNGGYNGGYGSYVVISHSNGTQTLYAHMSSVAAAAGSVEKGALIGYVGNTGKSTGNHLHFEVRGAKNPFAN